MILQELVKYYERKTSEPNSELPPIGLEWKEISYAIVIDNNGNFVDIDDLRSDEKKPRGRSCLVPQGETKGSGIKAQFMWENIEYLLGFAQQKKSSAKSSDTSEKKRLERVETQHEAFKKRVRDLIDSGGKAPSVIAVNEFLTKLDLNKISNHPHWEEMSNSTANLTFRLQGQHELVCENEDVHQHAISSAISANNSASSICLITGKEAEFKRLHPMIKGVYGAQPAGAAIVSFNQASFNSFAKEQGANAPISEYAATAYTSAINNLLKSTSRQKILLGDTSVVFWSDQKNDFESIVFDLFGQVPKEESNRYTEAVKNLYASPYTGALQISDDSTRFFVLGLSPNASRIAIRFWHSSTVAELADYIKLYFDDLTIAKPLSAEHHPRLMPLLLSTALRRERKNIELALPSAMLQAILGGTPFPVTLASAVLRRIRAERPDKSSSVTYERAALLKAYLNRLTRFYGGDEKEMTIELDESNGDIGYNLGRLFATLEKIQSEGLGELNAPIRDRYYSAASATPVTCFPLLMRMKNHHIAKIENKGRVTNLEKMISQIFSNIEDFPAHLNLADQGRFAIGYYHQRQKFYTKTTEKTKEAMTSHDN